MQRGLRSITLHHYHKSITLNHYHKSITLHHYHKSTTLHHYHKSITLNHYHKSITLHYYHNSFLLWHLLLKIQAFCYAESFYSKTSVTTYKTTEHYIREAWDIPSTYFPILLLTAFRLRKTIVTDICSVSRNCKIVKLLELTLLQDLITQKTLNILWSPKKISFITVFTTACLMYDCRTSKNLPQSWGNFCDVWRRGRYANIFLYLRLVSIIK
jgi:hypothetical protein